MKVLGIILGVVVALFAAMVIIGRAVSIPESDAAYASKYAVEAQLRDSGSAEFRNIRVFHPAGEDITVCGEVNGKNGFGGMAGFSRYFYSNGIAILEQPSASEVFDGLWSSSGCDSSKGSPKYVIQ